jgi:D-threo-aldose 1-dehydrogenase
MASTSRTLEWRRLGDTDVSVTALGLGCAPIAGLFDPVGADTAAATIAAAWDGGIRHFDTAPHYGAGLSELRLGDALRALPRDECTLSTKVGRLLVDADQPGESWAEHSGKQPVFDFSREAAHTSHRESLERLGLDRVEIALIHDPDEHLDEAATGTYPALAELRESGAVGAIGLGMNTTDNAAGLLERGDFDVMLSAGRYTLLDQSALTRLYPTCLDRGVSVIAAGVYNSGILADPRPDSTFNYSTAAPELVARALAIAEVCARHDVPLRAAAIQFPSHHPAVASVLVGARTPDEVDDALAMFAHPIPDALWHDLKRAGLLAEEAPTP